MRRFLLSLALAASPLAGLVAADAQTAVKSTMDRVRQAYNLSATSMAEETWLDRTFVKIDFNKSTNAFYGINTVQPLYRDVAGDNVLFVQAGTNMKHWNRAMSNVGLGYRYFTPNGDNMFGASLFYYDSAHASNGLGAGLSWFTPYTNVTLGRFHNVHGSMATGKAWKRFVDFNKSITSLDVSFQLPYLPWAEATIGKVWNNHRPRVLKHTFKNLDYSLTLNLTGPLAIEAGYSHGWNKTGYVNFVVSFGRPATRQFTLADGFLADEAFTPRDLARLALLPENRATI